MNCRKRFWNFFKLIRDVDFYCKLYCVATIYIFFLLDFLLFHDSTSSPAYYDLLISCLWNFLYQHICHLYLSFPFHLALHFSRYIQFRLLHRFHPPSFPAGATIIYFAIRLAACSNCDHATLHPVDCIPFELPRTNASFDSRNSKKELP